jgi:hypothetical protein
VADRVDELLHDLHTLKWTLLRICINHRPVYLQRLLRLQHAGEAFERFDAAVTEKVLDILAMERQDDRDKMRPRCLPLQLSGGASGASRARQRASKPSIAIPLQG